MPGDQTSPVVLLYVHALLGEGIASFVTAETGVPVRAVSALDRDAVSAALAGRALEDDHAGSPGAVLIDVSAAVTVGVPIPDQGQAPAVESIVHAVSGAGLAHPHAS